MKNNVIIDWKQKLHSLCFLFIHAKQTRKNRIPYIDYHSALAAEDGSFPKEFSYDGVHPNIAGYKVMEPLLLRRLK